MLVRASDAKYTIPLLSISESLRAEDHKVTMTPDGVECILVREEQIPILRLYKLFDKQPTSTDLKDGILVIIEHNQDKLAILVDEILGQHETVIKGLSQYLGNARGVSGCTILGDGEVSLILDIRTLLEIAAEQLENQ